MPLCDGIRPTNSRTPLRPIALAGPGEGPGGAPIPGIGLNPGLAAGWKAPWGAQNRMCSHTPVWNCASKRGANAVRNLDLDPRLTVSYMFNKSYILHQARVQT